MRLNQTLPLENQFSRINGGGGMKNDDMPLTQLLSMDTTTTPKLSSVNSSQQVTMRNSVISPPASTSGG